MTPDHHPSDACPVIFPVIRAAPPPDPDAPPRIRNRALSRLARTALRDSERLLAETRRLRNGGHPRPLARELDAGDLPKTPDGAPLPVDGIHWTLSHKPAYAGGLAAPFPVGLDVEALRPRHPRLLDKIALPEERACFFSPAPEVSGFSDTVDPDSSSSAPPSADSPPLMEFDLVRLFRIWTAKEAVLKLTTRGLSGLSDCRVIRVMDQRTVRLLHAGSEFQVDQIQFDGHMAAVAVRLSESDRLPDIRWTVLSPSDISPGFSG